MARLDTWHEVSMPKALFHRLFGIVPGLSGDHAGWDNLAVAFVSYADAPKGQLAHRYPTPDT